MLKTVRLWLHSHQTTAWALAAAVLAFLPILIGILTANPAPPASIYGFAVIASLLAGALAGIKTHIDEKRDAAKDQANKEALNSLRIALDEVQASRNRIEVERAETQYTLAFVGSALLALVEKNDEKTVTSFISLVLKSLHDALGGSSWSNPCFFLEKPPTVDWRKLCK